jgi:histone H4
VVSTSDCGSENPGSIPGSGNFLISDGIYNDTRDFVDYFLNEVVKGAAIFAEHARRKTITAMDVVYALKRNGRVLYGYGA